MSAIPIGELQVDSDLQLDVDGVAARLLADGRHLTLSTADAGLLLAQILRTLPPQTAPSQFVLPDGLPTVQGVLRGGLAQLAAGLDTAGLTGRLVDDRGTVLEVGRGCRSTLGRLLLGTERVELGPVSLRVARTIVRESAVVRRRLGLAAAGGAVAALVVTAGVRRSAVRGAR